ncbi:helix-turn-helix transcriptional regulator [Streptomyces sp. 8K308]|uniref:helix-turn-helix domain-containing protein n=1 Tax=Streptomyces sp. 8K308 TaxID=2530388 RepID=UPI00140448CF|nr:helix-turn-helix transcriptional regulator [Streptomyces sp. 8K308]
MAAWFGVELRNWRNLRRLSSAALGAIVHLSSTSVERIEKAERSCNAELAARFDDALDAGGALIRLWRRVEEDADSQRADADRVRGTSDAGDVTAAVGRRAFLAVGGLAALDQTSIHEVLPRIVPHELPRTVRPDDLDQVRAAARNHASWDNQYGGAGMVRTAAIGQLAWAASLLDVRCPPTLEAELFTAVGQLAIVMGASAFDAYEHAHAARLLEFGSECADRAGNWHLRATAYSWRSRQATWCGSPDAGLTLAETGLVRADRLTPRERGMLHVARARALAKMGARQETLAAIGHADDTFAHADEAEDPAWMAYYDYAQHHGDTGHAAFDIALLPGQSPALAAARLRTAIAHHTDAYVRSRALSGTKLATLTMTTGDPQEATVIANRALDEIGQLRSKRAVSDVRDLLAASARHARRPYVAELRERIRNTVLT